MLHFPFSPKKLLIVMVLFVSSFLSASLSVAPTPKTVFEGEETQFQRPEGFRFSPSGDCLAVTNSSGETVTVYRRIGDLGCEYEKTPACVLGGPSFMEYPHDLVFSSSGLFMAVACRETHSIVFFKRDNLNDVMFDPTPYAIIKGAGTKLERPAGISLSPDGQLLAIANRENLGSVTFYPVIDEENFLFSSEPIHILSASYFLNLDLGAPHDVAFSPDGKDLAIINMRFRGNDPGRTALSIFELGGITNGQLAIWPVSITPINMGGLHSVVYDPSGTYLAMTNLQELIQIFKKKEHSKGFDYHSSLKVDKKGEIEGVKGVDFSRSENCLGVTMILPSLMIFETFPDE